MKVGILMKKYEKQITRIGFTVFIGLAILIIANTGYTRIQLNKVESMNVDNDIVNLHIESVEKLNTQQQIKYDHKTIETDNSGQMTTITDQLTKQKYQVDYNEPLDNSTITDEIKKHQELLNDYQSKRDVVLDRGSNLHNNLFNTLLVIAGITMMFLVFFTENKKRDTKNTDD